MPCTEEYFYKTNSTDGLFPYCKKCNKNNSKQWLLSHPQRRKLSYDKYNTKDDARALRRESERKRRENGLTKIWQCANKDKIKQYRLNHNKHTISKQEWEACKKYFNYTCAYCGLPLSEHWINFKGKTILGDFHKEHWIHKGSSNLDNCVPSCKSCNSSKWESKFEDWYTENNEVFDIDRYNKIIQWINEDYIQYITK